MGRRKNYKMNDLMNDDMFVYIHFLQLGRLGDWLEDLPLTTALASLE